MTLFLTQAEELKDILAPTAKKSKRAFKSGKQVEISLVEGSFRRIAGLREEADFSGAFILRTVEIRREMGRSLGFYIREGDGWLRKDGIFISRVNLGSMVEINGLLHVGDEVLKINDVDVADLSLDDVVLIMTVVRKLVLTIKVLTSVSLTRTLSARMPRRKTNMSTRVLPARPTSMSYAEKIASKESEDGILGTESFKVENPYAEIGFRLQQINANLNIAQPSPSANHYNTNSKQAEEIEMSPLSLQVTQRTSSSSSMPSSPQAASTPVLPHKLQHSVQVEVHVDAEPPTSDPYEQIKFGNQPSSTSPELILPVIRADDQKGKDASDSHDKEEEDQPPPVPPTPPPPENEDDEKSLPGDEERDKSSIEESDKEREKSNVEEGDSKTELEEPDKAKDDHTFSGVLVATFRSLSINDDDSENGAQMNSQINRVEFLLNVDSVLKVQASFNPANLGEIESRTFTVDVVENQQISITLRCADHFSKSRQVTLFTSDTETSTRKFLLPIKLDDYGRARINVEYRPMTIAIPRMDPTGYNDDNATFKDFVETNPSNSKLPIVIESCIGVVEKYGLQEPNLYHLCSSDAARDEAFTASLSQTKSDTDIEEIVSSISVHAFTGVLKDFFRKLPEPFFTNKICTSLTEVASMENARQIGDFLKTFTDCLPEEVVPTYNRLLNHFNLVCSHSSENGMTVESLAKLFGPLLLTPALAQDLNTSATTDNYADDYKSQAKVIEILMHNSAPDDFPAIYKV